MCKRGAAVVNLDRRFADYKSDNHAWITLITGEYYPDILPRACELYKPVLVVFGHVLRSAHSATDFFLRLNDERPLWMRIQLMRVFRKYVSPNTPVEMLKRKTWAQKICDEFGGQFRAIAEVQKAFESRPLPDEALCAVLWEYKDRGKKGYDLTERIFQLLREKLPQLTIVGPERAGKDILLGDIFENYTKPDRPVDFVIFENEKPLAVGLARYDSDRGGAQEDDRTGQYRDCAQEVIAYTDAHGMNAKVIFVNDGPGLLLGSMWDDYAYLEDSWNRRVKVVTLRMIADRITYEWLVE